MKIKTARTSGCVFITPCFSSIEARRINTYLKPWKNDPEFLNYITWKKTKKRQMNMVNSHEIKKVDDGRNMEWYGYRSVCVFRTISDISFVSTVLDISFQPIKKVTSRNSSPCVDLCTLKIWYIRNLPYRFSLLSNWLKRKGKLQSRRFRCVDLPADL